MCARGSFSYLQPSLLGWRDASCCVPVSSPPPAATTSSPSSSLLRLSVASNHLSTHDLRPNIFVTFQSQAPARINLGTGKKGPTQNWTINRTTLPRKRTRTRGRAASGTDWHLRNFYESAPLKLRQELRQGWALSYLVDRRLVSPVRLS